MGGKKFMLKKFMCFFCPLGTSAKTTLLETTHWRTSDRRPPPCSLLNGLPAPSQIPSLSPSQMSTSLSKNPAVVSLVALWPAILRFAAKISFPLGNWLRFRCGLKLRVMLRPKSLAICGRGWKATKVVRGLLGTAPPPPPDPTLESASPSPPQGSIWHRFNIDLTSIRHRFDIDLTLFRCRIDAKSTPEEGRARRIRGWGPGGPVPNKPLTNLQFFLPLIVLLLEALTKREKSTSKRPLSASHHGP